MATGGVGDCTRSRRRRRRPGCGPRHGPNALAHDLQIRVRGAQQLRRLSWNRGGGGASLTSLPVKQSAEAAGHKVLQNAMGLAGQRFQGVLGEVPKDGPLTGHMGVTHCTQALHGTRSKRVPTPLALHRPHGAHQGAAGTHNLHARVQAGLQR